MNRYKSVFNVLMAVLLVFGALGTLPVNQRVSAFTSDLIISEYIEGSSNNKALEIYNGTGADVNLADYKIEVFSSGSSIAGEPHYFPDPTTLQHGRTFQIINLNASDAFLAFTFGRFRGQTSVVVNFNGDDAIVLSRKEGNVVVDSIGDVGYDPGTEWISDGVTTLNHTLVRKSNICSGDIIPSDDFVPSLEWEVFPLEDVSHLGSHTANCTSTITSTSPAINDMGVARDADIKINFNISVTVSTDWFSIACSTSGSHSATVAEASPSTTFSLNPDADFGYGETCTVTIDHLKVTPRPSSAYSFSFGTETMPPKIPVVSSVTPINGATGQAQDTTVTVVFDLPVTVTDAWYSMSCPASTVTFTTSGSGNSYTLTPADLLLLGETCTLTILATQVTSVATNSPMASDYTSTFTVRSVNDTGPAFLSSIPTDGAVNVPKADPIALTFDQPITVNSALVSFTCSRDGSVAFTGAISSTDSNTWVLTPASQLAGAQTCTLNVPKSAVADVDTDDPSDGLATDIVITFTSAEGCGDPITPIYELQGTGSATPYPNQTVSTEGVVVADLQAVGNKQAFFIRADPGDNNPASSDGLMIYTGDLSLNVTVGDLVRIKGYIKEFYEITEMDLGNPGVHPFTFEVCSQNNPVTPVEVRLPLDTTNPEYLECMLVKFPQDLYINDYNQFDQYGQITLGSSRHFQPTAFMEPGTAAQATINSYALDTISLDDGLSAQNPAILPHPDEGRYTQGSVGPVHIFRGGDSITNLTAIVDYIGSEFRLLRVGNAQFNENNPRTESPDLLSGEIRVGTINTNNFFKTLTGEGNVCGPDGGEGCRGAESVDEQTRQIEKIATALIGMNSDVIGLLELENDSSTGTTAWGADYAIRMIVDQMNAKTEPGLYKYVPTGPIGDHVIKVGMVYRTTNLEPLKDERGNIVFSLLEAKDDPGFDDTRHRPALAVSFSDKNSGEVFTLAINHLKSKDCAEAAGLDTDQQDGASCWNATRKNGTEALVKWLEKDPNQTGSNLYLIMGDLNAYAMEDPIDRIKLGADGIVGNSDDFLDLAAGFHTLHNEPGLVNYGYVFGGMAGSLDYAFASKPLSNYVLGAKEWHINADEADVIDYNLQGIQWGETYSKPTDQANLYQPDAYRSSDHDPILVLLLLNLINVQEKIFLPLITR